MTPPDAELLTDYCRGSQSAFTQLARRHVHLVYAAALRRTGDAALAEDVTQAAFLVLARKAHALRGQATVAGWLLVVTRNLARGAVRARSRRQRHEAAAATRQAEDAPMTDPAAAAATAELNRSLDDALAGLHAAERDAVALRFFHAASFADVGRTLGVSEEAARKRVARGVDHLRGLLARRGVVVSAVALGATLHASVAAAAPPHLAAVAAGAATTAGSAAAWPTITKGMAYVTTIKKAAVAAVAIAGLIGLGGGAIVLTSAAAPPPVVTQVSPPAPAAPAAPATAAPINAAAATVGEYFIGGDLVTRPGAYTVDRERRGRPMPLRQALLAAGAASDRPLRVHIAHREDGVEAVLECVVSDLAQSNSDDPVLFPNDVVQVTRHITPPGFEAALAKFEAAVVLPDRVRIAATSTRAARYDDPTRATDFVKQSTIEFARNGSRYDVRDDVRYTDARGRPTVPPQVRRIVVTPQQQLQRDEASGTEPVKIVAIADPVFAAGRARWRLTLGRATEGYFYGDTNDDAEMRISDVLRRSVDQRLTQETLPDGKRTWLLQGKADLYERKLWLDADTGLPVRVERSYEYRGRWADKPGLFDFKRHEVYDGFDYTIVGGRAIGRGVRLQQTYQHADFGTEHVTWTYTAQRIDVDPTFDDATDFVMALPDGTPVAMHGDPGVRYLWQDGRVVLAPNADNR